MVRTRDLPSLPIKRPTKAHANSLRKFNAGQFSQTLLDLLSNSDSPLSPIYFKFATRYTSAHKETPKSFTDEDLLREFRAFIQEQKFQYDNEAETKLKELREIVDVRGSGSGMAEAVERIKKEIETAKEHEFERGKAEILRDLKTEIMSRYAGERGRIEASLTGDVQLAAARGLLKDQREYARRW